MHDLSPVLMGSQSPGGGPLATPLSLHHLGGVQVCFIMHDLSPVLMGSQSPEESSGHTPQSSPPRGSPGMFYNAHECVGRFAPMPTSLFSTSSCDVSSSFSSVL